MEIKNNDYENLLFYFAYKTFITTADEIIKDYGLNRQHHRFLFFIEKVPGISIKDLLKKLEISKQTPKSYTYNLTGPEVVQRFDTNNDDPEFSLETGIIAETVEKTIAAYCLGTYTVNSKAKSVSIKIQIDRN